MNYKEAEQLAQQAFKNYFVEHDIPGDLSAFLFSQARPIDDGWHFEICLRPPSLHQKPSLENDLDDLEAILMLAIDVDGLTGRVELRESPNVLW